MSINRYDTRNATNTNIFNCNSDMCAQRIFVKCFFMVYSKGHESKNAVFSEKSKIRPPKGIKKNQKNNKKAAKQKQIEKPLIVFEKSVFMHVTFARWNSVFVKKASKSR